MMFSSEADRRRFKVKTKDGERHPYEPQDSTGQDIAREGYQTLVTASDNPYRRKERPVLGQDVETDINYVNPGVPFYID